MVYTNMIQAILMIIVALMLLYSGREHFEQGISGFWSKVNALDPNMATSFNPISPLFRDAFEVMFCNFICCLIYLLRQHCLQDFMLDLNFRK